MPESTNIIGTTVALIIAAGAGADLRYDHAVLGARSSCLVGSDHQVFEGGIRPRDVLEVHATCGGGSTSAYLRTDTSWFILSAGSSVPGGQPGSGAGDPVVVDGRNGVGTVEVQFTIDRPTLFRMSRCLEGSNVRFWDGDYQIAELEHSDDVTRLRSGTYWATLETDRQGRTVWAEIDWQQQQDDDPADVNGDGMIDGRDLVALITMICDEKRPASFGKGGKGCGSSKPVPGAGPAGGKRAGSSVGVAEGGAAKPSKGGGTAADPGPTGVRSRIKGDLDRNGRKDLEDIVLLMGRL